MKNTQHLPTTVCNHGLRHGLHRSLYPLLSSLSWAFPLFRIHSHGQFSFLHAISDNGPTGHSPSWILCQYLRFGRTRWIEQFHASHNGYRTGSTRAFGPTITGTTIVKSSCQWIIEFDAPY